MVRSEVGSTPIDPAKVLLHGGALFPVDSCPSNDSLPGPGAESGEGGRGVRGASSADGGGCACGPS